jgi:3-oxoacyl-[acyl-carrier protein] reductase
MLITFEGKRVIVAGAARGIGHAIATEFADNGGTVIACDRLVEEVEKFAGPAKGGAKSGTGSIRAAMVDVTDKASVAAVVESAGGPIDVLVYVAGGIRGQRPKPLEEVPVEDFHQIVDANLTGAFLFAQAVAPGMKRAKKGRIVTISSRAALAPSLTGIQAYASAKHGQLGLVRQLATELGQFGITVNTIAPGFLRTSPDYEPQWEGWGPEGQKQFLERIAMRRMGTPQDIAHAVMFLASDYASWITGQILPVMGSPT